MNNWLHMAFSESKPRSLVMHVKNMPEKTWTLFSRSKYYLFILMMYFPKWERLSLSVMIEFTGTLALHIFLLIAYSAGVNLQRHLLTFEETKGKQVTCNKLSYMGVLNKIITESTSTSCFANVISLVETEAKPVIDCTDWVWQRPASLDCFQSGKLLMSRSCRGGTEQICDRLRQFQSLRWAFVIEMSESLFWNQ